MKRLIIILFCFSILGGAKAQHHFYHLIRNGVYSNIESTVKNIRSIVDTPGYEAFGVPVQNQTNQVTYYYRRGTDHVTAGDGDPFYRTFNIVTQTWSDTVRILPTDPQDSVDCRDVTGGKMDNDSTVLFYGRRHEDVYGSYDLFIQKCDSNNNFSAPVPFNWTGITHLQVGFFHGRMIEGDAPGEYYHIIYQVNVDTGTRPHYNAQIIKTTDYWNHYALCGVVFDGNQQFSETAGVNLGGGKFLALARFNQSGILTPFESTNYGVTWVRRGASNLLWYNTGQPEIPDITPHDGVYDIVFQCRDAAMLMISKNNTVASFGLTYPVYNEQEMYAHHLGTGTNPSLGYPSELKLSTGLYLIIFTKQLNNNRANIQWAIDDLVTDPNGIPPAPTIASTSITTESFRINVTGYTDKQIENIRYFSQDISTAVDFSSFVTCTYQNPASNFPIGQSTLMQNVRMTGLFDFYHELTTGTTYYYRIKACNNVGCSAYTTKIVTTL